MITTKTCEGCDGVCPGPVSPFRVTNHEGKAFVVLYCADCADLARADWNGETAAIEAVS